MKGAAIQRLVTILSLACAASAQPTPALAAGASQQDPFESRVAPASGEAEAAMGRFKIPAGTQVSLWAAEPMLANPVSFAFDEQGRCYVAETFRHHKGVTDIRDHMDWLDDDLASGSVADRVAMIARHEGERFADYGKAEERVRLVQDSDGDGKADTAVVFAGGFDHPAAGIAAGLLARGGDVYYTCIPDLWLLRDRDGDGNAEERVKLSTGYGVNVALLGHDLHGLRVGFDGRLYFSCGDRGFRVETETGVLDSPKTGAVLRCNLDGSGLEVWHSGLRNPEELVFDDHGNLWTGDNNSDGGDRARWVNVVEGGDSGWRYPYQWIERPVARGPWNDEKLWHPWHEGQAAYIVPPIVNLADGPSGLAFYPGTGLDPKWNGHFFLCDFRGDANSSGIHAFTVRPKGAFFEMGPVERFVWGSLVTDGDFGPDGSFYFLDWVQGWEQTGKGRIYRLRSSDAAELARAQEVQGLLAGGFVRFDEARLYELLAHDDQRVRHGAELELASRGSVGASALVHAAESGPTLLARLHGIWGAAIVARNEPGVRPTLTRLTSDREPEVRAQAVRVLGDERLAGGAEAVLKRLADPDARVRSFAAIAIGRYADPKAVDRLAAILESTGASDPNLRHGAVMGLLGCADEAALERLSTHASAHVRTGVVLVERRRKDARIARFLSDPEPAVVLEAARAIHDLPIEGALPALADLAKDLPLSSNAFARRVANALFRTGSTLEDARTLGLMALETELDPALRVEILEWLATWSSPAPRDHVTNFWRPLPPRDGSFLPEVADSLMDLGISAEPEPVLVAFARFSARVGAARMAGPMAQWLSSKERPVSARIAALEALEALGSGELASVEPGASELGRGIDLALADENGSLRAAGLAALQRRSPEEVARRLAGIIAMGEFAERREAYRILGRLHDGESERILLSEGGKLAMGLVPAELALDLVLALEGSSNPMAKRLLEQNGGSARVGDVELAPFLPALFGGDVERGKGVFERVDLTCWRCHDTTTALATAMAGTSAVPRVGPSLAGVAERLTRLQILESILAPNRRTTPGYQGVVLFLKDGSALAGRIVEESATMVALQDADGIVYEVDLPDIEERRPDLSSMPEDLAKSLTREEMRDLLEFLATR